MSTDELLFQTGICPNCPVETKQRFLFATSHWLWPVLDQEEVVAYEGFKVISLFRCPKCGNILFYSTESLCLEPDYEYGIRIDSFNYPDAIDQVSHLPSDEFMELSTLLYCTNNKEIEDDSSLDPSTPERVRKCWEIGIRVRPISNDLYALQLRKTLEVVCKDLGASEHLPSGTRAMLWQQIDELGKQNRVGEFICKAAHELKDISNSGAHYSELGVAEVDIRKLEHLLGLITNYVYGGKDINREGSESN